MTDDSGTTSGHGEAVKDEGQPEKSVPDAAAKQPAASSTPPPEPGPAPADHGEGAAPPGAGTTPGGATPPGGGTLPGAGAPAPTGGGAGGGSGASPRAETPVDAITRAAAGAIKANPRIQWLREAITAAIGVAITAIVLILLTKAFFNADDDESQREVLGVGLGLLGVVVGYYFGRVPAEHRADEAAASAGHANAQVDAAHDVATTATAEREVATRKVEDAKATTARTLGMLRDTVTPKTLSGDVAAVASVTSVEASLEDLLRRLK